MPSTRITVSLNSNRTSKAPLLLPTPIFSSTSSERNTLQTAVFRCAQTKLRLKKPARIYVSGGKEIASEQDWQDVLCDDVVLLVSAGEEYVGKKDESGPPFRALDNTGDLSQDAQRLTLETPTIHNLASSSLVDPSALKQLQATAKSLPGITHAVAQPDLHPGTKFPIGAVFVSHGWIHPPLIGGDIGCGMAWYRTTLRPEHLLGDKAGNVAQRLRGLEGSWRTQEMREAWLNATEKSEEQIAQGPVLEGQQSQSPSAGPAFDGSLGTIGAGNHFAEVQIVEKAPDTSLLQEDSVVLLVHSGSRGYGSHVLKNNTTDASSTSQTTSMRYPSKEADAYLAEHHKACDWAVANRDLIALRFFACLEPGDESWQLGIDDSSSDKHVDTIRIQQARTKIRQRKVVDIWHNAVTPVLWPPLAPTTSNTSPPSSPPLLTAPPKQSLSFIHRKGAAPVHYPSTSTPLPILPLPGSRATPTLILRPTLSSTIQHGALNALSLAHGAGRSMSRAKAASYMEGKYKGRESELLSGDIHRSKSKSHGKGSTVRPITNPMCVEEAAARQIHGGTYVICEDKALVWEEAGEAYKDVWDVGDDLVSAGVAEIVGWCRGVVSYKVRRE